MEKYFTTTVFAILFVVTLASADVTPPTGTPGVGSAPTTASPTQEAISACGGKNVGAACSYTGPDALTASGTCTKPEKTSLLACRENSNTRTVR